MSFLGKLFKKESPDSSACETAPEMPDGLAFSGKQDTHVEGTDYVILKDVYLPAESEMLDIMLTDEGFDFEVSEVRPYRGAKAPDAFDRFYVQNAALNDALALDRRLCEEGERNGWKFRMISPDGTEIPADTDEPTAAESGEDGPEREDASDADLSAPEEDAENEDDGIEIDPENPYADAGFAFLTETRNYDEYRAVIALLRQKGVPYTEDVFRETDTARIYVTTDRLDGALQNLRDSGLTNASTAIPAEDAEELPPEDVAPASEEIGGEEYSFLITARNNMETSNIESLLRSENIPYIVKEGNRQSAVIRVMVGHNMFGSDFYVPSDRLEAATDVISALFNPS